MRLLNQLRRVLEPILTIIDPASSPFVARGILKDLALIFLTVNAVVSFALIMTMVVASQYTPTVKAFSIAYIVVSLVILIAGSLLLVRRVYFESHPLRSPPAGYARPDAEDDDRDKHRYSTEVQAPSSVEDVRLGDMGEQHSEASPPTNQVQHHSRYSQNPYRRMAEASSESLERDDGVIAQTDGALSKIAKGVIPNHHHGPHEPSSVNLATGQSIRFPFEQTEAEPTTYGNHVYNQEQSTSASRHKAQPPQRESRQYPRHSAGSTKHQKSVKVAFEVMHQSGTQSFGPSMSQLTGRILGTAKRYQTYEQVKAGFIKR
ncbi:hypothetical protein F5Y05DRAFT_407627 [Hypoxylon sp. FL0543]|nr:hypothetical protein F5Y05DRAFT_407627 [Hypoxylon sp. FL0543]